MTNELTIKITGEAGQGIQTIGAALCRLFKNAGFHIFANQDFMSRIRGGNNFFQLRISDKPLFTLRQKSDITIALDKVSVALHRSSMTDGGILVLDRKKFNIIEEDNAFFDVPFYDMAARTGWIKRSRSLSASLRSGPRSCMTLWKTACLPGKELPAMVDSTYAACKSWAEASQALQQAQNTK